jgi:hypothetical protein
MRGAKSDLMIDERTTSNSVSHINEESACVKERSITPLKGKDCNFFKG